MKNCTPLWRAAHFQVKTCKTPHARTLLEIETSKKCTPLWREAHVQAKMDSLLVFGRINSRGGGGGHHPRDGLLGTWPSHRTEQFKPRVPPPPHQEKICAPKGVGDNRPLRGNSRIGLCDFEL